MEKSDRQHDYSRLLELYAGRVPTIHPGFQEAAKKKDLHLGRNVIFSLASRDMDSVVRSFEEMEKGDPKNLIVRGKMLYGEARIIHTASVPGTPLMLSVRKNFSRFYDNYVDDGLHYPPRHAGEEHGSVAFEFYDEGKEIGGYRLDHEIDQAKQDDWELNDRLVLDEYRGQGFGAALMLAVESFVQEQADMKHRKQKLVANVAQPNVLCMLLNKGFHGATPEDDKRIGMILEGHPDLVLDYALHRDEESGEMRNQIHKDLYCFQKNVSMKTERTAFRVRLEKEFVPKGSATGAISVSTRKEISGNL